VSGRDRHCQGRIPYISITGASGYLTKDSAPDQLVTAIRRVVDGGRYLSPWLSDRLAREVAGGSPTTPHEQLSDREYQVMLRIASGRSPTQQRGRAHRVRVS